MYSISTTRNAFCNKWFLFKNVIEKYKQFFLIDKLLQEIYNQFLFSDLNIIGDENSSKLKEDLSKQNDFVLKGPLVVQVDEIVDISTPLEDQIMEGKSSSAILNQEDDNEEETEDERDTGLAAFQQVFEKFGNNKKNAFSTKHLSSARILKLSLTDGARRIFAMEMQICPQIHYNSPPGLKLLLKDVSIKRGMLLLKPNNITVLGGEVEDLIAADLKKKEMLRQKFSGKE